jgi:hypothetical protein
MRHNLAKWEGKCFNSKQSMTYFDITLQRKVGNLSPIFIQSAIKPFKEVRMSSLYLILIYTSTLLIWQISEIKSCPTSPPKPKPKPTTTTTLKPKATTCNK